MPPAMNQDFNTVYVIAPMNCSSGDAQRAKELTADLKGKGIPAVMTSRVQFNPHAIDPNQASHIRDVMEGRIPIVFIRGKAKCNPSLKEVAAEYKGQGRK